MLINSSKGWVTQLSEVELPVLAYTLQKICMLTADSNTPVNKLADAVLQDPDLTSTVIRLANSACYNPGNNVISTISRAVMVIGFDTVKSIAIAATLVDKISQGNHREHLYRCLVRSFHAAVQAKYLAATYNSSQKEEVFVAALLFDVGEAAFWASDQPQVVQFSETLARGAENTGVLQQQEFGASFCQISRGLIRRWNLGPLLEESIDTPSSHLARIVRTASTIAKVGEKGWSHSKLTATVQASAKLTGKDPQTIQQDLKKNAEIAASIAEKLGIKNARKYLFGVPQSTRPSPLCYNFDIQIKALQALSSQIVMRAPVQEILNSLIQGIHKGIGLERVGLFLAKQGTKKLYLSSAEGFRSSLWQTGQSIEAPSDYLLGLLRDRNCHTINLVGVDKTLRCSDYTLAPFKGLIPAIIAPLDNLHPEKGFIYADRLNQQLISIEQFESFKLFMLQLQLFIQRDATAA